MRAPRFRTGFVGWPTFAALWIADRWFRYFITGRSLTGNRTDNATMFHAASKDYRDRPYETLTGPIWQRLARRWALAGVPLLFLFLAVVNVFLTGVYMIAPGRTREDAPLDHDWVGWAERWELAAGSVVLLLCARLLFLWVRDGRRMKDFVYPTWEAACGQMGIAYHKRDARKMVRLPEGFEPPDAMAPDPNRLVQAVRDRIELRRLKKETERIAAEADTPYEEPAASAMAETQDGPPGAEIVLAARSAVARFRGRLLDREPMVPGHHEVKLPPVVVGLKPGRVSTPAAKKAFLAAVTAPLGMPDASAEWFLRGRNPFVELRPNLLPPELVTFDMIRRHFLTATIDTPVIGLAAGGRAISIDFANNSPHSLISGGSGTGKSVLEKAILCQRMHHGAGVIMLDYKRVSHRWLHNLPGCIYAWRLVDIHDVLVSAGVELDRRLETVLPPDNDITATMLTFPTIDVVVEEINSTTMLLTDYWKEQGGQGQSPAISALKRLVNMGREYHMHVHVMAQRASAGVFGGNGGDIRESFQTRLMAKWTVPTWKMLAGGAEYRRPLGGRGIWARVQDDEVEIVRTPMLTDVQAREWAMSGEPCPATPDVLPDRETVRVSSERTDRHPDAGPELVVLSKAVKRLPGRPLSIEGLRTASKRPGFPAPATPGSAGVAALYDFDRLVEWKLQRDGFEAVEASYAAPAFERPTGYIYALDCLDPETGGVHVGYVGKTTQEPAKREAQHRGDKPFSDLIVGTIRIIWEGNPTPDELGDLEVGYIRDLKPRYNVAEQKGEPWAMPVTTQIAQRHARDKLAGRPLWLPVDVYHGGRIPEGGYGEYVYRLALESRAAFANE
jgi:hypothetical protein